MSVATVTEPRIIFAGTFAELQEKVLSLDIGPQERVLLAAETPASPDGFNEEESAMGNPSPYPTLDQIKELSEDDLEKYLRPYRLTGH